MTDSEQGTSPKSNPGSRRRPRLVIAVTALVVAGVVALLAVGLANQGVDATIQDAIDRGERIEAPTFDLPILSAGDGVAPVGATRSLEDLRGRVVVLNFWASWCKPCNDEAPILEGIARGYRERKANVVVLGINVQNLTEEANVFIRKNTMTFPSLRDGTDGTFNAYEVRGLPETFVIDETGRIAVKITGVISDPRQITVGVEQILG